MRVFSSSQPRVRARLFGLGAVLAASLAAAPALASENAASLYLLGSGGPGAAILPPLKGVYFDDVSYFDDAAADARRSFLFNGNLVADVSAQIGANFATVLYVPTTHFAGGTLAVGAALPFGSLSMDASAVVTGPLGRQFGASLHNQAFFLADPLATASLGWKRGNLSVQASTLLNIPVGQYDPGQLVNLSFHRWAGDVSWAATWHDEKAGWDVSGKAGVTFNGTNTDTQYTTGTELHLEAAVAKAVAKGFWIGGQGYYFDQLTGDSGPGAKLGPFKGRVAGLGATASHDFVLSRIPGTIRLRGMTEFDVRNRLQGRSAWLEISFPLSWRLPASARP
jgi:hypothetical protein